MSNAHVCYMLLALCLCNYYIILQKYHKRHMLKREISNLFLSETSCDHY